MNPTVKKLLLNLYFFKQLIIQEKYDKAKMFLENETGLDIEDIIENHNDKSLEEAVSNFTMEIASLEGESFDPIALSFTEFISALYYNVVDINAKLIEKEFLIEKLNILFRFPLFEATLLHYVQNELIEDQNKFNNVVLSTYIHISHIKFLALLNEIDELNAYIYEIGIDNDLSDHLDIDSAEIELLKVLKIENTEYVDAIVNYFNCLSNEINSNNLSLVITSTEYLQENLRNNIYIKNIV